MLTTERSATIWVTAMLVMVVQGQRGGGGGGGVVNCPDRCLCFRTTVRCMFLQLEHVPRVPPETTILDLRFNKIKDVPAGTFDGLHLLNTLLLNNNLMTKIENDAFRGLRELKYLYLYKNRIKTIESKAFRGLDKLEQLYLHFNRIENLERGTFSDLNSLDRLFLHNNKLTRIPPGVFHNLDSLRRLRLDSNALICDCKMMWLARMLKDKLTTTQAAATCEYPSTLQGKQLIAIQDSDFHCKKPLLTEEPNDVDVSFGGTAYFTCRAEGDPNPDIIWLHNDDEIDFSDTNSKRYNLLKDGTLMIENTQASDQGIYVCMAKNMLGEVKSRKAKMKHSSFKEKPVVNVPSNSNNFNIGRYHHAYEKINEVSGAKPKFVVTPQGQEVRERETVILVCEATGHPLPVITWTFNDYPIKQSQHFHISATGTLTIIQIQSEDSGLYRCSATNSLGQISSLASVKVQVPPTILTYPQNFTVSEGRVVEFICAAQGSPQPHLTWLKNGRTIVPTTRIIVDLGGTHLRIGSVRKSDEGRYRCRAQNIAGTAEASAVLIVKAKIPPSFQRRPHNIEVNTGSNLELPCSAYGEPTPLIIWRKDGILMSDNHRHSFASDGSLKMFNVNKLDEGMYECGADNGIGYISSFAHVKIRDPTAHQGERHPGDRFVQISLEEARFSVDRALNDTITSIYSRDRPFTPSELLRLFRFPGPSAREIARSAEIFERTLLIIKRHVESGARFNLSDFSYSDILSPTQLETIANLSGCLTHRRHINCSQMCFHSRFRTIDGTCNNLQHPMWGASETPFYRLLKPKYENGFNTPIGWSRTGSLYHGFPKPSARLISTRIISTDEITADDDYSHMLMQWGQFLDHDLDLAPPTISSESFVDGEDCSQSCEYAAPCFPIDIPPNDPRIQSQHCMEFTRSSPVCGSGSTSLLFDSVMPREQINVLTSFIDASQVYGSSERESEQIRDLTDRKGRLRNGPQTDTGKYLLPFSVDWPIDCRRDPRESSIGCFLAGDTRVNEQVALITMHTIWFREHNRIAEELHTINPHWDSETLYQEARKIVGAEMQHITYKHWLPKVFGTKGMELLGSYEGYNPNIDASISNSFATAALRFGHTLINPILHRLNSSFQPIPQGHLPLSRAFFSPFRIMEEGGIDPLLRGLFATPAKFRKSDQLLNKELTEQLFRQVHAVALDLAAINIQRGRDHALPGYNEWRAICNLTVAKTFNDLRHEIKSKHLRNSLQQLYGHPDNIDLWVGGVSEDLAPEARVGPTFLCILANQFNRLREGDRFYYENPGIFKPEQLTQIKQSSLARILCDNGDKITDVTRDAFVIPQKQSPNYEKCDKIQKMDLRFWSECCNDCSESGNFLSIVKSHSKRSKRSAEFSHPEERPSSFHHSTIQSTEVKKIKQSLLNEDLFEERVEGMEEIMQKLQRQLKHLNKKMKLLQNECNNRTGDQCIDSSGFVRYSNETWMLDKCTSCHCHNSQITCQVQVCLQKDCKTTLTSDNCCQC